jgi:DNA-binding transcriptional ArsR family regulator
MCMPYPGGVDTDADGDITGIAALLADPARAAMLDALFDGRARSAGELARHARVSAPTASSHLRRLLDGGLVVVEAQGRHRYYRLSGPPVAEAMEALSLIAPPRPVRSLRRRSRPRRCASRAPATTTWPAGWGWP